MKELERLEELKKQVIDNPPKKVKGGCKSCKKKKDQVTEVTLPIPFEPEYIPSLSDLKLAYLEMNNMRGIDNHAKPLINKVFLSLYNEPFDFDCRSCISKQVIKFYHYLKDKKII